MIMNRLACAAACLVSTLAVGAVARDVAGPAGYLAPGAFDALAVLPPAPRPGDARAAADRAIFAATRALKDTPRWQMATNDVRLAPDDLFRDFSCAAGVTMTPQTAPRTATLIRRALTDTGAQSGTAKTFYKRLRPFQIDTGPICQPAEELKGSYDYPSGHTTAGWTFATLLARLMPDQATAILARGRAFGESRIVCGVHNASAVEAGRLTAAATLTAMADDPAFVADLAAARAEIAALRGAATTPKPDAARCAAEATLVAQRIY
jgi:acid phosphatase (class A)